MTDSGVLQPTRYVNVWIDVPAAQAYEFAADMANMPRWAAGLDLAAVTVKFAPRNELGVLDHTVAFGDGPEFFNPMRVVGQGEGRQCCEVVFGVRRRGTVSDADFEADVAAVRADLATLKALLESESG